jgi:hypothetical protein
MRDAFRARKRPRKAGIKNGGFETDDTDWTEVAGSLLAHQTLLCRNKELSLCLREDSYRRQERSGRYRPIGVIRLDPPFLMPGASPAAQHNSKSLG